MVEDDRRQGWGAVPVIRIDQIVLSTLDLTGRILATREVFGGKGRGGGEKDRDQEMLHESGLARSGGGGDHIAVSEWSGAGFGDVHDTHPTHCFS